MTAPETKPEYDYNTPIEKTSVELAKMILARFDELKDTLLIESYEKLDPLARANFAEKSTDFAIEVMRDISKSDIPFPYATKCVDKIIQVLEVLKKYIEGSIEQARHEYASRSFGVKSPANGKYREEDVTLGLLLLKLEEVRQGQGDNKNDYFTIPEAPVETPAEQPAPEAELSTNTPEAK